MAKEKIYYEPDNYIPKEIRKKFGLGEFNKEAQEQAKKEEENKKLRDLINNEE